MDWKRLLAYISGTVDQELLLLTNIWSLKTAYYGINSKTASGLATGSERP